MIKGGYQKIDLSPADLTASTLRLDGLSKACAGANGKAVLVKLPDGTEAFGAVDETDDGFVLSAMAADSKVSQFNVDDADDTFTMQTGNETSAGAPEYKLISTATLHDKKSASAAYVAEYDGLAWIYINSNITTEVMCSIRSELGGTSYNLVSLPVGSKQYTANTVFVRKGTKLFVNPDIPEGVYAKFYRYELA